jgi:hypothetical protein
MVRLDDLDGRAGMVYVPPSRGPFVRAPGSLQALLARAAGARHR